jgi:hypothetical protein
MEQRIAEADQRPGCGARAARRPQRLQRGDSRQHGDGVAAGEPSGGSVIAVCWRGHEHLERQLPERPGEREQQMLALDQVFDRAKQRLVEAMGAGVIEGERFARC